MAMVWYGRETGGGRGPGWRDRDGGVGKHPASANPHRPDARVGGLAVPALQVEKLTKEVSFLLMRLSVVRPIETRKFITVSRQYLNSEAEAIEMWKNVVVREHTCGHPHLRGRPCYCERGEGAWGRKA